MERRSREHPGGRCTLGWGSGVAHAKSQWKGQGSLCWLWGDPGTRRQALGTGVVGRRPGVHHGTQYTQVGETEEGHAGGTHCQHLMFLGERGRDQTECVEGVRMPGGHHGARCTQQVACGGRNGGVIHSQRHRGLGRRGRGHAANSVEAKRLEAHPGAQCTQHREAGRAQKSGEPPVS